MDKAKEVADQARRAGKESYQIAGRRFASSISNFFSLRESSEATFEFLTNIVNAKDIQAAARSLRTKHAQRQQEL